MKRILPLIAFCLFGINTSLFSQEDREEMKPDDRISLGKNDAGRVQLKVESRDSIPVSSKDTTIITTKNKTIYIVTENHPDHDSISCDDDRNYKAELTHWAGLDIGINGFVNADGDPDLGAENDYLELNYAQSRSISFNVWEQKIRVIKDYVGFTTGAGLQYNSYRLKNDYTLASTRDTLVAFYDSTISVSKNKFRTTWVNVPLLLEFNTSLDPDRSFHISAGVVGGLHLGSMYKQKYDRDGVDYKTKSKSDFQVAPYKLEAMLRIGYGSFNLFASYQMTELFEDNNGPELYPFTVGVTLVAFD